MVADANTDETHWLETESMEDWVTTQHKQVYFRNEGEFRLYADSRKLLRGVLLPSLSQKTGMSSSPRALSEDTM